jgi:ribonuclease HI
VTLFAYTDGASRGNPGESGIGFLLRDNGGNVIFSASGYIGQTTNNSAEYEALLRCLEKAASLGCTKLIVHSDSELMVRQLRGEYRVKDKNLQKYFEKVRTVLAAAPFTFEIKHIARTLNREADVLANEGIDRKQPLVLEL